MPMRIFVAKINMNLIKNLALALIAILLSLLVVEIVLSQATFVSTPSLTQDVDKDSPIIHFKPNNKYTYAKEWDGKIVVNHFTNDFGFNTPIQFTKNKKSNCIVGDSFVEAMQVNAEKAFHGILSGLGYAVYPIGISGSPLSQYLAFAKWAVSNFDCQRLIFVVIQNDFDESMISYKNSPGYHYFNNHGSGELELVPYYISDLKLVFRKSALANYLFRNLNLPGLINRMRNKKPGLGPDEGRVDEERLRLAAAAIDYFFHELDKLSFNPDQIIMVLDGDRHSIYREERGRKGYNKLVYSYFISKSKEYGASIIDLHPVFQSDFSKRKKIFNYEFDYHWNEIGHSLVAKEMIHSNLLFKDQEKGLP